MPSCRSDFSRSQGIAPFCVAATLPDSGVIRWPCAPVGTSRCKRAVPTLVAEHRGGIPDRQGLAIDTQLQRRTMHKLLWHSTMKRTTVLPAEGDMIVRQGLWPLWEWRQKTADLDASAAKVASAPSVIFSPALMRGC